MHVLIIEDDPSIRSSIELVLKSEDYTFESADSGGSGLDAIRDKKYDIILLDLTLPDVSGQLVLGALRSAKINMPVLVMSDRGARDEKIKTLDVGADDYVTKPFDRDELMARVKAIVRRAKGKTRLLKSAALDGALLARRGGASPWSFTESYTPTPESHKRRGTDEADDSEVATPDEASSPEVKSPARDRQPAGLATLHAPERKTAKTAEPIEKPVEPTPLREVVKPNAGAGRVIVLGCTKGGTGKSTTAMHLIVALLAEGNKVGSIDLDMPQGTLTRYLENRRTFASKKKIELSMPVHHTLDSGGDVIGRFEDVLGDLTAACDYAVIDTPGYDGPMSRHAHAFADTLITPINDSFLDLDSLAQVEAETLRVQRLSDYSNMVFAAKERKEQSGGRSLDWIVVRNRLSSLDARNKRNLADAIEKLSEQLHFRGVVGLSERVIYRELFLQGLTLLDLFNVGSEVEVTMGHVAALQELRMLLDMVRPKPPQVEPLQIPRITRTKTGVRAAKTPKGSKTAKSPRTSTARPKRKRA